jgi:gas vesicle protein
MRYDDAARRYNFLAGLGIGAVLGVGLALLALPQKKVLTRHVRGARHVLPKGWGKRTLAGIRTAGRGQGG